MTRSKCCNTRLVPIEEDQGPYGKYKTGYLYCSRCGLMYYKIKRKVLPDEMDEWD